jgi:hypothetical protein
MSSSSDIPPAPGQLARNAAQRVAALAGSEAEWRILAANSSGGRGPQPRRWRGVPPKLARRGAPFTRPAWPETPSAPAQPVPTPRGDGEKSNGGASAGDARPAFGIHPDSINILWRSYRRMVEQAGTGPAWRRLRAAQARLEVSEWVGAMPPENRRGIGEIYARIAAWLQSVDMGGAKGAA